MYYISFNRIDRASAGTSELYGFVQRDDDTPRGVQLFSGSTAELDRRQSGILSNFEAMVRVTARHDSIEVEAPMVHVV